jgi:restriction endonuclease Mrr
MFKLNVMRRATPLALGPFVISSAASTATRRAWVSSSPPQPSHRRHVKQPTIDQLSKRIVLIDGDQLTRLMIRHGVGCRIEETLYIKKVDEEFFE